MMVNLQPFCAWQLGQMTMSPARPHKFFHVHSGEEKYNCRSVVPQSGQALLLKYTFSGFFIMLAKTSSHGKYTFGSRPEALRSSMMAITSFFSIGSKNDLMIVLLSILSIRTGMFFGNAHRSHDAPIPQTVAWTHLLILRDGLQSTTSLD